MTRLQKRDGLDQAQAQARVDAQMKIGDKVAQANYVIENEDGDLERLESAVKDVFYGIARDGRVGQRWAVLSVCGVLGSLCAVFTAGLYSLSKFMVR